MAERDCRYGRTCKSIDHAVALDELRPSYFPQGDGGVLASMRNPEKEAELAKDPGVVLIQLDITDPGQIESAAARTVPLGGVDVVFNNAATGFRDHSKVSPTSRCYAWSIPI